MTDLVGWEADRELLERTSTADRVAEILRTRIAEGFIPPGERLSEVAIGTALGVSRNTLREAFRLLTHEGLLEHQFHRGVFVRMLSVDDLIDIYRIREVIERAAIREFTGTVADLRAVQDAIHDGERAKTDERWRELGTANIHFHQAIAALTGSRRVDKVMAGLLAELRLVFHVMADPKRFHEPYLDANREIFTVLEKGDLAGAEALMATYLGDSKKQLVDAYAARLKS